MVIKTTKLASRDILGGGEVHKTKGGFSMIDG